MTSNTTYYRPIQYLGSKTRAISSIVSECKRLYNPNGYIVDLFSGSSIVSQAFYKNGMRVISNDVLAFCSDIATCMLNQYRGENSIQNVLKFIDSINNVELFPTDISVFKSYIGLEEKLLSSKNLLGLKELYSKLPQIGKNCNVNVNIEYIKDHIGSYAFQKSPLIANYYAGTYFGIKQSLNIDALRMLIEEEWASKGNLWEYSLLLTALYNTCSIIVNSAGKHFAQPIIIDADDISKITNRRMLENRCYDVKRVFQECVINICSAIKDYKYPSECISLNMDVCSSEFNQILLNKKISVLYADPPYTAQQYSRFYHIPEVLHFYVYPKLQIFRGSITQGIYPDNKYKSPFCSKSKARKAFSCLFEMADKNGSHLILSYSESKNKKTGNERMISLDELLQLAKTIIPRYNIKQINFDFDYKQFNRKDKVVEEKEDKEFLIIFEKA